MSELSPLWKEERKLDFGTDRAAFEPTRLPIDERCSIASGGHDAARYIRASVRRTDGVSEDS